MATPSPASSDSTHLRSAPPRGRAANYLHTGQQAGGHGDRVVGRGGRLQPAGRCSGTRSGRQQLASCTQHRGMSGHRGDRRVMNVAIGAQHRIAWAVGPDHVLPQVKSVISYTICALHRTMRSGAITAQHIQEAGPTEVAFPRHSTEKRYSAWAKKREDWYGPTVFELLRNSRPLNAVGTRKPPRRGSPRSTRQLRREDRCTSSA